MQSKVTKVLIWLGFISMLAGSIPHVAWVFHSYEEQATTITLVWWTFNNSWFVPYLQAISIDVLIAWLSHVLTNRKNAFDIGTGYLFMVILVVLSWYANWLFDKAHAPDVNPHFSVWSASILWGWINIGRITPIIVSALPLFAIGYAFMLSKVSGEKLTAAQLEEMLKEKQALDEVKTRYQTESKLSQWSKKAINEAKEVATLAQATFNKNGSQNAPTPEEAKEESIETTTSTDTTSTLSEAITEERHTDSLPTPEEKGKKRFLSLEDAIVVSGYSREYLQKLVASGKVKHKTDDKTQLLSSSLSLYMSKNARIKHDNAGGTGGTPPPAQDETILPAQEASHLRIVN